MTWNTESVVSSAVKRRKDLDHCHNRKRFTIKSQRPSYRHRVTPGRSLRYSVTTGVHKKHSKIDGILPPQTSSDITWSSCGVALASEPSQGSAVNNAEYSIERRFSIANYPPDSEPNVDTTAKRNLPQSFHVYQSPANPLKNTELLISSPPDDSKIETDLGSSNDSGSRGENKGSKVWRLLKVRRRGSKRNGSKFTMRRKKQIDIEVKAEVHPQKQEGDRSLKQETDLVTAEVHPQNEAGDSSSKHAQPETDLATSQGARGDLCTDENVTTLNVECLDRQWSESPTPPHAHQDASEEPISLQDIEIELKSHQHEELAILRDDSLKVRPPTPAAVVTNAIQECAETECPSCDQDWSPDVAPLPIISHTTQKHRPRKIQVRMHRRPRKIIVIGDMSCGKSNLISAYSRDRFTSNYTPTILNCNLTDARIHNESIELVVIEISGRDDFEPLRRRAYRKMDAAVICYAVDDVLCFERICKFWVPELRKYAPNVPFVLVGTKRDVKDSARDRLEESLRSAEGELDGDSNMCARLQAEVRFNERFVSKDRGKRMAESVGADSFMECSSLYRDRTRDVFETVTMVALRKSRRRRRGDNRHLDAMCAIL